MRAVRGLIFDLGSTLWERAPDDIWHGEERPADARAGAALRREIGPDDLPPLHDVSLGTVLRRAVGEATNRAHHEEPDDEPDFAEITRQALEALLGRPVELSLGVMIFEALRVRIPGSRVLLADAISTLQTLVERGYSLGVATNRSYGGDLFLEDLGTMRLMPFFAPQAIAVSADLGVRKPNPLIFQYALAGLGLPAAQVAMIGDHLIADVWGGERAHLATVWKPGEKLQVLAAESPKMELSPHDQNGRSERLAHLPEADADLVRWAERHAHTRDHRTLAMRPPDAVIRNLGDVLSFFPEVPQR